MFNTLGNSIPRNGLVGEWLLDGNALDTASTNNGTATNVTYVKTDRSYQSQAGSFNGSSSNINLGTNKFPTLVNNCTFTAWIRNNSNSTTQSIFSNGNNGTGGDVGWYFGIKLDGVNNTYNFTKPGIINENTGISPSIGKDDFICLTITSNIGRLYINSVLVWTGTNSSAISNNTQTAKIGCHTISSSNAQFYNGNIQGVRLYNRVLSQDEITLLYREGQRLLGPTSVAKYPSLLSGLVGYFRAEDTGGTALYNLVNGITATIVGGTNTADNLGINKAISNPNYTWASLTYTTGYTFENSGSGWNLVTSPSGLSATGINRTTTLRDVFLFNRTLSTDERNLLESLCNSEYPYPTPSYDIASLRDGLVLDLNEQGQDLSGNNNNGTLVNGPSVVRQGRAKGLSYNGSNQYVLLTNNNALKPNSTNTIYFSCGIKTSQVPTIYGTIATFGYENGISGNSSGFIVLQNNGTLRLSGNGTNVVDSTISVNDGKYHRINIKLGASAEIWIDGVLRGSGSLTFNAGYSSFAPTLGTILYGSGSPQYYYSGQIFNPRINNIELGVKKIQEGYYSQKANFIY